MDYAGRDKVSVSVLKRREQFSAGIREMQRYSESSEV